MKTLRSAVRLLALLFGASACSSPFGCSGPGPGSRVLVLPGTPVQIASDGTAIFVIDSTGALYRADLSAAATSQLAMLGNSNAFVGGSKLAANGGLVFISVLGPSGGVFVVPATGGSLQMLINEPNATDLFADSNQVLLQLRERYRSRHSRQGAIPSRGVRPPGRSSFRSAAVRRLWLEHYRDHQTLSGSWLTQSSPKPVRLNRVTRRTRSAQQSASCTGFRMVESKRSRRLP